MLVKIVNYHGRQAQAMNIATNVLEIAKSTDIAKLNSTALDTENEFLNNLKVEYNSSSFNIENANNIVFSVVDTKENHYKVYALVEDYKDSSQDTKSKEDILENIVKKINITVQYRSNNETKSIEISTLKKLE